MKLGISRVWIGCVLLLAAAGAVGQQGGELTTDQTDACGAVMCLMGGSGVSECDPYLARFFSLVDQNPQTMYEMRKTFLDLCPGSDPGFNGTAASMAEQCESSRLVKGLNADLQSCTECLAQQPWQGQGQSLGMNGAAGNCPSCAARSPGRAGEKCGAWYATSQVVTKIPHIWVGNCGGNGAGYAVMAAGGSGLNSDCTFRWEETRAPE